jgi:predicted RNase H-like nuclease
MSDSWEDWENDDYIVPTLNKEQFKILEERKLVEESDNLLTKNLFSNEEDLVFKDLKPEINFSKNLKFTEKKAPKTKNAVNNREMNEEKQKIMSKIIKQKKADKQREKELFGEAENDEYDKYLEYEEAFY